MIKTTRFRNLIFAVAATAFITSCTEESDETPAITESEVTISATLGISSLEDAGARTTDLDYGNFSIESVKVSIDNVKLILRATSEDKKKPSIVQIRNNEPQILNLVEDGEVQIVQIGSVMAADGVYGKLNLDFVHADVPEDDEMHGLSIFAKVTWFGVPAEVSIDIEDEMLVQFNQGIEVAGAQDMLLTMYMDKFLEGVNPALVSDGNGDGLIEVGPDNVDGNGQAYDEIVSNIESALEMKNGKFKDK